MKGLLIYDKKDELRNREYIQWLLDEANKKGINLSLLFSQDFFRHGLNKEQMNSDFALNRSRSYELAVNLELNGIRVLNNSEVTFLGNNKIAAYKYAEGMGVDFPPLLAAWQEEAELISKQVKGHGGEGVEVLKAPYPDFREESLQQSLEKDLAGDLRFYIFNNEIIHSVLRRPKDGYISNFSKGGSIEIYGPSPEEERLVKKFIGKLQIDYAGIDFLLTKDGRLLFNEIEDAVGSRMLSALGINDTTELLFQAIREMKSKPLRK